VVPPCSDRISRVPPYSRINWHLRIRGYHPLWPDFPDRFAYLQLTTGLFRVRSPLLAESLLMSFPPGTEMFQFPGFASTHYVFMCRYRLRGGLPHSDIHGSTPARGSPWLFAACHVLHRLLVPRHPPNALLILDIPVWTVRFKPHHAQKPSSGYEGWSLEIYVFSATQHDRARMAVSLAACATMRKIHPLGSFIAPLNPRRPTVGAPLMARMSPFKPSNNNSRSDKSAEQRDRRSIHDPKTTDTP
jgi:hypothetical protein